MTTENTGARRGAAEAGPGAVRAGPAGFGAGRPAGPDRRDAGPEPGLARVTAVTVGPCARNKRTWSSSAPGWPGRPRRVPWPAGGVRWCWWRRSSPGTGAADFGPTRLQEKMHEIMTGLGVPAELMTSGEAAERWPGISFGPEPVMFHPDGGVIDPERAMAAMR